MKYKVLLIASNYYNKILEPMISKTMDIAKKENLDIKTITVPGVFEIPVIISKNINKYDAFIALGCVIKGETPHFDYISRSSIDAIMKLSMEAKKPIGNGIITCLNMKQAIIRSKKKGQEVTKAIIAVLKNVPV